MLAAATIAQTIVIFSITSFISLQTDDQITGTTIYWIELVCDI